MKPIKYTCKYCGNTSTIDTIKQWLSTPHFGVKKYLKCKHCDSKRHYMTRQWNRSQIFSIDWYKDY